MAVVSRDGDVIRKPTGMAKEMATQAPYSPERFARWFLSASVIWSHISLTSVDWNGDQVFQLISLIARDDKG